MGEDEVKMKGEIDSGWENPRQYCAHLALLFVADLAQPNPTCVVLNRSAWPYAVRLGNTYLVRGKPANQPKPSPECRN